MTLSPPPFHFYQIRPHPALQAYVRCYRIVRATSPSLPVRVFPNWPSGTVDLAFTFARFHVYDQHQHITSKPHQGFVIGPTLTPYYGVFDHTTDLLNIHFTPAGASAILGLAMDDLRGHYVALDTIWPPALIQSFNELAIMPLTQQIAGLNRLFLHHLTPRYDPKPELLHAIHLLMESHGQLSIRTLHQALRWSERTLERHFRTYVGLTPKEYARLLRFRRAMYIIGRTPLHRLNFAQLAQVCGFYDQPHLGHELAAFTGLTPTTFAQLWRGVGFLQDRSRWNT